MSFWKKVWNKVKKKKNLTRESLQEDEYLQKLAKKIKKLK